MSTVEIVFMLLCKYQPGGAQERTVLLRDLSENRLSANASVKDLLTTLRTWRRNLGRATELGVQLPDPLLLVGLLTKWSDLLSRLGGSQMAFRIAGMRQMLALDTTPVSSSVVEFAEHLQAEAEQLMLATPTSTSTLSTTTTASSSATTGTKKDLPSVKAFTAEKGEKTGERPKCRFWGTSEKPKIMIVEEKPKTPEALVSDLSSLVKSLQSLKALQLRYLEAKSVQPETKNGVRVALVDGGATHALRRGTAQELSEAEAVTVELAHGTTVLHKMKGCGTAEAVTVELAHGTTVLHKMKGCGTLLTKEEIEPILPVRRDEALALLKELEDLEVNSNVDDDVMVWWQQRYPNVPK
eukprot:s3738_g1.t1